jgi:hypothetical protein
MKSTWAGTAVPAHQESKIKNQKLIGGQGRNRTSDTVIFSHVLYQLSYLARDVE